MVTHYTLHADLVLRGLGKLYKYDEVFVNFILLTHRGLRPGSVTVATFMSDVYLLCIYMRSVVKDLVILISFLDVTR